VAGLFASGRIVDLILGLTLLEGLLLALYHRRTGRGVAPADLVPNLLAGACILLAGWRWRWRARWWRTWRTWGGAGGRRSRFGLTNY
jgi:hypothetical protein